MDLTVVHLVYRATLAVIQVVGIQSKKQQTADGVEWDIISTVPQSMVRTGVDYHHLAVVQ